jgi:hypothetical protein
MTRFLTIGEHVPRFSEHGLDIARAWRNIDVESLSPEARDMLELQVGRLVMIHEFDIDKYVAASAPLELFEGKFRYPFGTDLATVPPIGRRHQDAAAAKATPPAPVAQPDGPAINAGAAPVAQPDGPAINAGAAPDPKSGAKSEVTDSTAGVAAAATKASKKS